MSESIAVDSTYSLYSLEIGNTRPPLQYINSVAFNGSYWVAVGSESVKTNVVNTYQDVRNLEAQYNTNQLAGNDAQLQAILFNKIQTFDPSLNYTNIVTNYRNLATYYYSLAEAAKNLSISTFNDYKSQNLNTSTFTKRTLHTIAISYDGKTWTLIDSNPFSRYIEVPENYQSTGNLPRGNAIAWNGSKWIAVGYGGSEIQWNGTEWVSQPTVPKNQIATSTDGLTWNIVGSAGVYFSSGGTNFNYQGECRAIAASSSLSVIVGEPFSVDLPFNSSTNTRPRLTGCIAISSNTTDWTPIESNLRQGYCVAYNGATWVAGGEGNESGTFCLVTSTNGTNWFGRIPYRTSLGNNRFQTDRIVSIAWGGNSWLGVGKRTTTEADGSSGVTGIIIKSSNSIDWTIESNFPEFNTVTWDGNFWLLGGTTLYKSKDGTNWIEKTISNLTTVQTIASRIVLPILGGTINDVNSLIVGYGAPMSVLRSFDDVTWIPQVIDGEGRNFTGVRQREYYDAIWTGSKWVIVGESYSSNNSLQNIAVSENAVDWTFPSNGLFKVRGIAYNGSRYVAVGEKNTVYAKLAISDNGTTWTSKTITLDSAFCVASNGSYWLAGGTKATNGTAIIKSTDGDSWANVNICPLTQVNKLAWNGYIWVAIGDGIALSTNGNYWYKIDSPPFTTGNSIAWNRSMWVAVGVGENTVATSVDGFNWTGQTDRVFGSSGTAIGWNGTSWIASGIGFYPMASSTDGLSWSKFETTIERAACYVNKEISLPYTGVSDNSLLTSINAIVSLINSKTQETVAEEEEAAKILADELYAQQVAAAALAARNQTKSTALTYKTTLTNLKTKINNEFSIIKNYYSTATGLPHTKINVENEYPYEYYTCNGLNEYLNTFITDVNSYYDKIYDDTNSQDVLDETLILMEGIVDTADEQILDFYNTARILYKYIINDVKDSVLNTSFESIINNFGFTTQTKQSVLDFYNAKKTALTNLVTNAVTLFDTEVTSTTNTPNLYSTYNSIVDITSSSLSQTYLSDDTRPYQFLIALITSYITAYPKKQQCDRYYNDGLTIAENWANISSTDPKTSEIQDEFNVYYDQYYYTLSPLKTPDTSDFPVRFFKLIYDKYTHIGSYATELDILYTSLKNTVDTINTTSVDAINYITNKRNTTIKNALTAFQSAIRSPFSGTLATNTFINTLLQTTSYSKSSFQTAKSKLDLLRAGSLIYDEFYPLAFNIQKADLEADEDGALPPKTGWGGSTNGLTGSDIGAQGASGWEKYNNTYYTRQKLADYIRLKSANGNILGINVSVKWSDFLTFTASTTYTNLNRLKEDVEAQVSDITTNALLTTTYADNIVSQDISAIDSAYVTQGQTVLSSYLVSVSERLPSNQILSTYGNLTYNNSATLQTMVNNINSTYSTLQSAVNIPLFGKTKQEIAQIILNASNLFGTIETIFRSTAYTEIINGIPEYEARLARATKFVETVEDNVARFMYLKNKITNEEPFALDSEFGDGDGKPFIISIPPTTTRYWTERTHKVVTTFDNQKIHLTSALPPLNVQDYAPYRNAVSYELDEYVVYNGLIYQCIATAVNPGDTNLSIKGILPTNTLHWVRRTYPVVFYRGKQVEPSPSLAVPLNYLEVGYYDNNWMYFEDDVVAYNGKIYECTNTVIEPTNAVISGIPPTNPDYWKIDTSQTLDDYDLTNWVSTDLYVVGSIVLYNGDIYRCEQRLPDINYIPPEHPRFWRRLTTIENLTIPDFYNNTAEYSLDDVVTYKSDNVLRIYVCYRIDKDVPDDYTYPTFVVSDEEDADGNYKLEIESPGTYDQFDKPRQGRPSNTVDPFRVNLFAKGIRREVAMLIEMPFARAFRSTATPVADLENSTSYNFTLLSVKPSNATTLFNNLKARLTTSKTTFDTMFTDWSILDNLILKAYEHLVLLIQSSVDKVKLLRASVNTIKTQYFNLPPIQQRIYNNPYSYLNPISAAVLDKREFRDLGVGDEAEILYSIANETDPFKKATQFELDYHRENQARVDELENEIYDTLLTIKLLVGYDMLVQTASSKKQLGSRIICDSSSFLYVPIMDYNGLQYYDNPPQGSLLWYVNQLIIESTKPPAYVTDPSLASALTWESNNPFVVGLSRVAKGIVGLTVAAWQSFVPDPFAIFGIVELVSGGAVPAPVKVSWPTFHQATSDRKKFKQIVDIAKDRYVQESAGVDLNELDNLLMRVSSLIFFYQDLAKEVKKIRNVRTIYTVVGGIPPNPPGDFVPPIPRDIPDPPYLAQLDRGIRSELRALQDHKANLENEKRVKLGKQPKPPTPVDIPSAKHATAQAILGNRNPTSGTFPTQIFQNGRMQRVQSRNNDWKIAFPKTQNPQFSNITPKGIITNQAEIDDAYRRRDAIQAEYHESTKKWNAEMAEIDSKIANVKSDIDATTKYISEDDLRVQTENAKRTDANLREKERVMQLNEEEFRKSQDDYYERKARYEIDEYNYKNNRQAIKADLLQKIKDSKVRLILTETRLADGRIRYNLSIVEYQNAFRNSSPIVEFISARIPANIRANYAKFIDRLAPLSTAINRVQVYTKSRPAVLKLNAIGNSKTTAKVLGGIGVVAELAGIGLTAWQDGAFED
jgi:hypothetical protein